MNRQKPTPRGFTYGCPGALPRQPSPGPKGTGAFLCRTRAAYSRGRYLRLALVLTFAFGFTLTLGLAFTLTLVFFFFAAGRSPLSP